MKNPSIANFLNQIQGILGLVVALGVATAYWPGLVLVAMIGVNAMIGFIILVANWEHRSKWADLADFLVQGFFSGWGAVLIALHFGKTSGWLAVLPWAFLFPAGWSVLSAWGHLLAKLQESLITPVIIWCLLAISGREMPSGTPRTPRAPRTGGGLGGIFRKKTAPPPRRDNSSQT